MLIFGHNFLSKSWAINNLIQFNFFLKKAYRNFSYKNLYWNIEITNTIQLWLLVYSSNFQIKYTAVTEHNFSGINNPFSIKPVSHKSKIYNKIMINFSSLNSYYYQEGNRNLFCQINKTNSHKLLMSVPEKTVMVIGQEEASLDFL